MSTKTLFSIVLITFYIIIGVATTQAPRHLVYSADVSPVNINHSKHILFFENFNTNKNNWPEGIFEGAEYYFDNGQYVFSSKEQQALVIQNVYPSKTIIPSKDWIYETTFSVKSQNENSTTYLLWGKNGSDFEGYGFFQKNNQSFIWHGKRVDGTWKGSTIPVNHYPKNNSSVTLSVHKVNSRLDFYLNKQFKFSKQVTAFVGNELAIAIEGNTEVAFDQITLKQLQFLEDGYSYSTDRSRVNYNEENKELVPMRKVADKYFIPIYINNSVSAQSVYDQWTAATVVSEELAERLIKSGTIKDWIGEEGYQFKNGIEVTSSRFILNTLKIGKRSTLNVECMIIPTIKSEMLIGTAVLSKLGKYRLDATHGVLLFED